MARLTKEERAAQVARDNALIYGAAIRAEQVRPVVRTPGDVRAFTGTALAGSPALREALMVALSRLEMAHETLGERLRWLREVAAEAQDDFAERRVYTNSIVQGAGGEVDTASGQLYMAMEAARELCGLAGVYCPLVYTARQEKQRAERLRYDVVDAADAHGCKRVELDGVVLMAAGESGSGLFVDEAAAWAYVAQLLGEEAR